MTNNLDAFQTLCTHLNHFEAVHIPSPPKQKRRAAVVALLRWRRHNKDIPIDQNQHVHNIKEFFNQNWVKEDTEGEAEILFMQRTTRTGDRWSGHVSFVGGKNEPGETDEETAKREVMEEIGIDLNCSEKYLMVGKLNDREVTSIKDNKLLMVLIPFVYLQVVPESEPFTAQESEVAALQWVPLSFFLFREKEYPSRLIVEHLSIAKQKNKLITPIIKVLMGTVTFPAVDLPTSSDIKTTFRLWGLTLVMTRDIMEFAQNQQTGKFLELVNRRPVFSRPDIGWLALGMTNFVFRSKTLFNKNYDSKCEKYHWDKIYYSSIRKAIIIAVLLRFCFTGVIINLGIKKIIKKMGV